MVLAPPEDMLSVVDSRYVSDDVAAYGSTQGDNDSTSYSNAQSFASSPLDITSTEQTPQSEDLQAADVFYYETGPKTSSRALLQPIKPAALRFPCKVEGCPRRFTQQRQLDNHMKKHRMYSCNVCPAVYPHPKSLREHKQTKHLGKRYPCDVAGCDESVAQKKNLARHKAIKHGIHVR